MARMKKHMGSLPGRDRAARLFAMRVCIPDGCGRPGVLKRAKNRLGQIAIHATPPALDQRGWACICLAWQCIGGGGGGVSQGSNTSCKEPKLTEAGMLETSYAARIEHSREFLS